MYYGFVGVCCVVDCVVDLLVLMWNFNHLFMFSTVVTVVILGVENGWRGLYLFLGVRW